MLKRIKRIRSHTGHARFLAECAEEPMGWIPCQPDIPSPYAYSQEWTVWEWQGRAVMIRETSHRCFDVFEVPEQMVRNDDPLRTEQESNYLRGLGV